MWCFIFAIVLNDSTELFLCQNMQLRAILFSLFHIILNSDWRLRWFRIIHLTIVYYEISNSQHFTMSSLSYFQLLLNFWLWLFFTFWLRYFIYLIQKRNKEIMRKDKIFLSKLSFDYANMILILMYFHFSRLFYTWLLNK